MSIAAYDAIAAWYDESVGGTGASADPVVGAVLELAGDVTDLRVCDLACGQGLAARELARRGARVVGIDLSARLLEFAREYEAAEPLGIVYREGDAQLLAGGEDESYDGLACNLALMDIPDLPATLTTVRRVLRPGGWFVFSITHPCFQLPRGRVTGADGAKEEAGYFSEGFWRSDYPEGVRGKVGAHHRTLDTYLNALAAASLILERVVEPRPVGEAPGTPAVPKFLAARCRRG
jgi:2-polyprenyl-3-methyl-5-hydroxy-6-metoxy-1,4-benzoquinol methylase